MTQRIDRTETTRRVVHPNGSVSHFHVREGAVLLASLHPEHPGRPALLSREELFDAWDKVTTDARAEGLLG